MIQSPFCCYNFGMDDKKKRILITGANGFIGFNVLKYLYDKNIFSITALVHNSVSSKFQTLKNINIIKSDVTKEMNLPLFDIVIHCAGYASDVGSDDIFRRLNFESVKNVSKFAKEKFIHISSTDVYGIKDFCNADENTPFHNFPKNPYPKYKIEAENWIKNNYDKKYVILRPAAVWGENDKTIENRVTDFLKVSPYFIYFGKWKGKNRWPLTNVENIAKVIFAVCMNDDFDCEAINIIDSKITAISEYYQNIAKKYFPEKNFKTLYFPLWFGKNIGFISVFLSDILKLKKPLFDPTYYSLHHISSNLDFNNQKMLKAVNFADNLNIEKTSELEINLC